MGEWEERGTGEYEKYESENRRMGEWEKDFSPFLRFSRSPILSFVSHSPILRFVFSLSRPYPRICQSIPNISQQIADQGQYCAYGQYPHYHRVIPHHYRLIK